MGIVMARSGQGDKLSPSSMSSLGLEQEGTRTIQAELEKWTGVTPWFYF